MASSSSAPDVLLEIVGPHAAVRTIRYTTPPPLLSLTTKLSAMYNIPLHAIGLRYIDPFGEEFIIASDDRLQAVYRQRRPSARPLRFMLIDLLAFNARPVSHATDNTAATHGSPRPLNPSRDRPLPPLPPLTPPPAPPVIVHIPPSPPSSSSSSSSSPWAPSSSPWAPSSSPWSPSPLAPPSPNFAIPAILPAIPAILPAILPGPSRLRPPPTAPAKLEAPQIARMLFGVDINALPQSLRAPAMGRARGVYFKPASDHDAVDRDSDVPPSTPSVHIVHRPRPQRAAPPPVHLRAHAKFACTLCYANEDAAAIRYMDYCAHALCRECIAEYVLARRHMSAPAIACPACAFDPLCVHPGTVPHMLTGAHREERTSISSTTSTSTASTSSSAHPSTPHDDRPRGTIDLLPPYTPLDGPQLDKFLFDADELDTASSVRGAARMAAIYFDPDDVSSVSEEQAEHRLAVPGRWRVRDTGKGKGKGKAAAGARTRETFRCGICMEDEDEECVARVEGCRHAFCRDCVKEYVVRKLRERRFPVVCPVCAIDAARDSPGTATRALVEHLGLDEADFAIFTELELGAHAVQITCDSCKQTLFVDREEYESEEIVTCPLPWCAHTWCRKCSAAVDAFLPGRHRCVTEDGTSELRRLMDENGWRDCPGCNTPTSKNGGCNHMTCITPGCNAHFCYRCGALITKSVVAQTISDAIHAHYASCEQFDPTDSPRGLAIPLLDRAADGWNPPPWEHYIDDEEPWMDRAVGRWYVPPLRPPPPRGWVARLSRLGMAGIRHLPFLDRVWRPADAARGRPFYVAGMHYR